MNGLGALAANCSARPSRTGFEIQRGSLERCLTCEPSILSGAMRAVAEEHTDTAPRRDSTTSVAVTHGKVLFTGVVHPKADCCVGSSVAALRPWLVLCLGRSAPRSLGATSWSAISGHDCFS